MAATGNASTSTPIDPSYRPKILRTGENSLDGLQIDEHVLENISFVLVLYTGGTIGMKTNDDGVYVPEPNYLVPTLRKEPIFNDPFFGIGNFAPDSLWPLVLPKSKEGKRVIYVIYEYDPLLDSSNMTYDDYIQMANDIKANYNRFDGFVILHGTDTMAYTASALSFMLENLGKPVIVTGSQIPIFQERSDGIDNFMSALILAGQYAIPEVCIMFDTKLFRGNRSTKIDASGLDGFDSPNMTPLAKLEIDIIVDQEIILPQPTGELAVFTNINPNVGVLRFTPSITTATVSAFLQPPMKGVVLHTYGAGNGPTNRDDLMTVLRDATAAGIIIVNITQCLKGFVSPVYQTGSLLEQNGVIPGYDMTVEGALMKLSYILNQDLTQDQKREAIEVNLRGEITSSVEKPDKKRPALKASLVGKMVENMRLSSPEEIKVLKDTVFPPLLCSAAKDGNVGALKNLREAGAVFSMSDYDSRTPLHVASCEGHQDVVKYLLENGAPVHVRDRFGHTPLDDAVRLNRHDIIRLLKDAGAHLRLPPQNLGLMMCNSAVQGSRQTLMSWVAAGANVNQGGFDGRTPLHLAAAHGNEDLVQYLLDVGAKPDEKDLIGKTAKDEATTRNLSTIQELLNTPS